MELYRTSIVLDVNIYNKTKELSKKECRNFSKQVEKILKDYLEKERGN